MPLGIGLPEMLIVLVIALVVQNVRANVARYPLRTRT